MRQQRPLDGPLSLVVVHQLLPLGKEGVHTLISTEEPVHTNDGLEGQEAVERREKTEVRYTKLFI